MEHGRKEFLEILCHLYIVTILAVVPLYTGGTYWQIGDSKYLLFRNISFICIGIWLIFVISEKFWKWIKIVFHQRHIWKLHFQRQISAFIEKCNIAEKHKAVKSSERQKKEILKEKKRRNEIQRNEGERKKYSLVDIFMGSYGVFVLISAFCSSYRNTAFTGYRDWYMGAVSQIIFVGIYFFVSRQYNGAGLPVYLGEAALIIVVIIGFLNKLGIDPLGLYVSFATNDWEYSHMLSTIGNINWLCGYFSPALAFPVAGFLYGKKDVKMIVLYGISIATLTLLWIQGSDGGVFLTAACIGVCLLAGGRKPQFFKRGLLLAAGFMFLLPIVGWLVLQFEAKDTIPKDAISFSILTSSGWWVIAGVLLLLYLVLKHLKDSICRKISVIILCLGGLIGIIVLLSYMKTLPTGNIWGSGRAGLWQVAWEGFCKADVFHKIFGVGPDCFAEYVYNVLPAQEMIYTEGRYEDAIYANAHNEWLNHLVNIGIAGTISYFGIFLGSIWRYRGMMLGVLAICLYGMYSLISFQQVISTPILFLILGMCENRCRRQEAIGVIGRGLSESVVVCI